MKRNKHLIWIAIAAFCVLAALLLGIWISNRPMPANGEKAVTVEVFHKDGHAAEFSYQTDKQYLGDLLLAENLIAGTESVYGLFVDTVDGEAVSGGDWWKLSCNGEDAATGVSAVVLRDGDVYGFTYVEG